MGETAVEFTQEQLDSIGKIVQLHIHEWIGDREFDQRERIIRVEESLKNQQELMKQGFNLMEKRFEQIDKRFEQVDKRFEQVDKRFEKVDKRFESQRQDMNDRFARVDKQFGWVYAFLSATFVTILSGVVTLIVRLV